MSGSIGGSRIRREEVEKVVENYSEQVLKPAGISHFAITGSYNAGTKKDHGDIDLVVLMDGNKKEAKKRLKESNPRLNDKPKPRSWLPTTRISNAGRSRLRKRSAPLTSIH